MGSSTAIHQISDGKTENDMQISGEIGISPDTLTDKHAAMIYLILLVGNYQQFINGITLPTF